MVCHRRAARGLARVPAVAGVLAVAGLLLAPGAGRADGPGEKTVAGVLTIAGKQVPLPPGTWVVAATGVQIADQAPVPYTVRCARPFCCCATAGACRR